MDHWRAQLEMLTADVLLINLAYLILVSGTLCRSVTTVRMLLILGAACFAGYGAIADIPVDDRVEFRPRGSQPAGPGVVPAGRCRRAG